MDAGKASGKNSLAFDIREEQRTRGVRCRERKRKEGLDPDPDTDPDADEDQGKQ